MSDPGPVLWIVSPSYRDVEAYRHLRRRLLELLGSVLQPGIVSVEFVVVDDTGGLDPQIQELCRDSPVRAISLPFNVGHQRALVYGLRIIAGEMADDDYVVTLDADGEDRPEDLQRLLDPLRENPGDLGRMVLALRTGRRESFQFKLMYLMFRLMFRVLTGTSVRTGNFAAYRGWLARRLLRHPHFDLCYSSTLISLGLVTSFVPCQRGTRYAGRSRMNGSRLLMHGIRMLMPFTDRIAIRSLVVCSFAFAAGVILSAVVLAVRTLTTLAIPGWATSTLLLILILSFVALGNFVVLFIVFSHSRGISLASLEATHDGRS